MRPTTLLAAALLAATPALAAAQGASGPLGTLYLTDFFGGANYMVQGTTATQFGQAGVGESAIAVSGDVRTLGSQWVVGAEGAQYGLDGVATSTTYGDLSYEVYDGATDGQFNYAVEFVSGGFGSVLKYDRDWNVIGSMFMTDFGGAAEGMTDAWGITYDPFTQSLWLANSVSTGSRVVNVSMTGAYLGGFTLATPTLKGLAMDYTDGTLWMASEQVGGALFNYTTAGVAVGAGKADIPGLVATSGAEFNYTVSAVPEPGTYALLATGLVGVAAAARRRKTSV